MGTTQVELDRIGPRRWRLFVVRDGWVIEDRELRGGRRKAKRVAHQVFGRDERSQVHRVHRGVGQDLPDSGGPIRQAPPS